jgi:AbrB family looped-hinge helix DNA binding protein
MRTKVSSRGQTAVPAEVRRRFGLTERSQLEWLIDGDLITVLPVPENPARAFRGILRNRYSTQTLRRERSRERAREKRRG